MIRVFISVLLFSLTTIVQSAQGVTITFDEFPADNNSGGIPASRYAYLGVTFHSTHNGKTLGGISNGDPGNWDLDGTNGPLFSGYNNSDYANTFTLNSGYDFISFSLDVSRSNGSSSSDTFTLEGYKDNNLIESVTVPLPTINIWTTVSLTLPADEIRWVGSGGTFRPYGIDNLNFTVPEPASLGLMIVGCGAMMRRVV